MTDKLSKVSKISIYLLVFLLPLFFLPWTTNVLDFNKQALLVFLVFISLFCWLLKSLQEGKISLSFSLFTLPVLAFLIILGVSTLLSSWSYGSFWGWPLDIAPAFLTTFCFVLLYFLIVNSFQRSEIFGLFLTLAFSGFLAALVGGLQLFGKFYFPFDFSKVSSFNTVGTVNSLGVFAALLLPLIISLFFISKRLLKVLLIIFSLVDLVLIFLVNFWVAWLVLLIGMAAILIFIISRGETLPTSWLVLPMFLIVISLCFGVFRIAIPGFPATPLEVSVSQRATFDVARKTLTDNSPVSLLLGSGPSTFAYDYSKFKSETINQTALWAVRFGSGSSEILDRLATGGILGFLSFLAVLVFFLWTGVRGLISSGETKSRPKDSFWILSLGIFASWLAAAAGFFFYPANLSLNFLFWLFTAGFLVYAESQKVKSWELKAGSLANIGVSFLFIVILIFGIGLSFLTGQRYVAQVRHLEGVRAFQKGDYQAATDKLLSAISHTAGSQDNHWQDLSQIYLFRINEELLKKDVSKEELQKEIPPLVSNAINSAKQATDVAPKNVANWSIRGYVYRNVTNLITGAEDWAIKSYEEAIKLEPANPYLYTELGQAYLAKNETEKAREQFQKALELKSDYAPAHFQIANISVLEGKTAEAIEKMEMAKTLSPLDVGLAFQLGVLYYNDKQYDKAKAEFERAVSLNENYSNARYFLGLICDRENEKTEAISQFEKIAGLNPDNEEVKQILANLRAGKPALEGVTPSQPPIEEKPSEQLK